MDELIEICRTCLSQDEKLLPINSTIESDCQIADYFKKYLKISLVYDDNLPSNICLKCLNKLLEVRKFYLLCQDSENYLKLKLQIPSEEIKSNIIISQNQNEFQNLEENIGETFNLVKEELKIQYFKTENPFEEDFQNTDCNSTTSENFSHYEVLEEYVANPIISTVTSNIQKENHECRICNESFKYIKNLQFHIKLHKNKNWNESSLPLNTSMLHKKKAFFDETALTCKQCHFKFAFRTNYNIHMRRHAQKRKYSNESCICSVCGKRFQDKKKLQKHMYRHNNKYNEILCPICDKTFKAKYNLKIHMNQHTGAKPFKCNICNKNFVSPSSLRLHKTLHDGKKIQCPVCDTKLAAKTQLKTHMRMHTNERPYICSQCPKSYKQLCALKVHIATHSAVKSVQCEECSACFYSKNHLLSHKIKMHRPKRFHCNKCLRQCSTPFQMKSHLLSVHQICVKDLNPFKIDKIK